MEPRTLSFIIIFIPLTGFAILTLGNTLENASDDVTLSADHAKVLLDCKHPNYRTYIKCLKRQKRQHHLGDESHRDNVTQCMETCMQMCNGNQPCEHCRHCFKRSKFRHQFISEYETECTTEGCKPSTNDTDKFPALNITTKIDIHNHMNTSHACPTPPCGPFSQLVPQISLVPQITFGLGSCPFPYPWFCQQNSQPPQQPPPDMNPVDCTYCNHPVLHYRCPISCSVQYSRGSVNATLYNSGTSCQSPHCIGGSQG